MAIPRHVVFLAVGCGRRRAPARHCKGERSVPFALAMACWRATAFISRREKVHVTRNDHVVPRRTTNKTLCALRPPSPSGKSIPPPLRAGIWKISLRKKSQPPPKLVKALYPPSPGVQNPRFTSPMAMRVRKPCPRPLCAGRALPLLKARGRVHEGRALCTLVQCYKSY